MSDAVYCFYCAPAVPRNPWLPLAEPLGPAELRSKKHWHSVFIIRCVSCCVEPLGAIAPPSKLWVTRQSVKLSYRRPAGADPSKVLVYLIKYRKQGSHYFQSTRETSSLRQVVSGLDAGTRYEFRVVAWYRGESSKVESSSAVIETDGSKCALLNFPYSVTVSQVAI